MNLTQKKDGELIHYGVLGMKWGRRKRQETSTSNRPKELRNIDDSYGSKRSQKKLNKALATAEKYGSNANSRQSAKIGKMFNAYQKSAYKDMNKAAKRGDSKTLNTISAGRTYVATMMNSSFHDSAIASAAVQANVKAGKDFMYKIRRNNSSGTVSVSVNGKSTDFVYMPEA